MGELRREMLDTNTTGVSVSGDTLCYFRFDGNQNDSSQYLHTLVTASSNTSDTGTFNGVPGMVNDGLQVITKYNTSIYYTMCDTSQGLLAQDSDNHRLNISFWVNFPAISSSTGTEASVVIYFPGDGGTGNSSGLAALVVYNSGVVFNGVTLKNYSQTLSGGHHYYVTTRRDNFSTSIYRDGTLVADTTASNITGMSVPWYNLRIACNFKNGYASTNIIDDFYMSYGPRIGSSNFTPPTRGLPIARSAVPSTRTGTGGYYRATSTPESTQSPQDVYIEDASKRATITATRYEYGWSGSEYTGNGYASSYTINGTAFISGAAGTRNNGVTETQTLTNVKLSDYGFVTGHNSLVCSGGANHTPYGTSSGTVTITVL